MGGRKTILIVEDENAEAITEAAVIRDFGYVVLTVNSGEEAVPLVLGRPDIDLVLMDIELGGGISGGECAKRILETRSLPIVFLTSHAEQETVERVRHVTRYGYVFKDSGEAVLQSSIEMAFDLFEARQDLARELDKRKTVERAVVDEFSRRQVLFDEAPDGILIIEPATARFLEFNTTAHRQLGYTRDEFARLSIADIEAMETPDETHVRIADVIKDGRADFDTLQRTEQGEIRDVHVTAQVVMVKGEPVYYCFWRDITERRQIQEANRKLLAEKELLLKEVHHRIKNNITLVQSLLSLQAAAVKDPTAKSALNDSKARLQSMMLLYDKLYRSERFNDLPIDEYLGTLLGAIIANYPNRGSVTIEKHLESFMMDSKRLSSIGIIVNELVTNIMKHAFQGRKGGKITMSVAKQGKRVTLSIGDDGVGIPTPVDLENSPGFGLQLVSILTEQVEGTIQVAPGNGTTWTLHFDI